MNADLLLEAANDELWRNVPSESCRLAKAASSIAAVIRNIAPDLPDPERVTVWYSPDDEAALFHGVSGEKAAEWANMLTEVPFLKHAVQVNATPDHKDAPWLLVKCGVEISKVLSPLAVLAGHKPGLWPFAPNTLTATLGSGMVGAGLGYGLGWLGEKFLPSEHFEDGKLRKTTAILGGLGMAAPSLWYGLRGGYGRDPQPPVPEVPPPAPTMEPKIGEAKAELLAILADDERYIHPRYERYAESMCKRADDDWAKQQMYQNYGGASQPGLGTAFLPVIPVDQFNKVIWNDPFLPASIQAATSGLISGASTMRGDAPYVSPADVLRVGAAGVAGALSGGLAGQAAAILGGLAGLKPKSQQVLQQTGMLAGIVMNVVPRIFGGR